MRSLSSTFIFEFDERIRDLPGSLTARAYAVDTAIRHLDSLAKEAGGDPSLQTELAAAYVTASKIQADPSMPNLGKPALAIASLDKAIQLANEVLRSQPDHLPALRALCAGLRGRALMVGVVRRQRKEGMETYRQAVAVADRMERQQAALTTADYRVISEVHTRLADFLAPATPAEAKGHFEKALAMNARALETGGNNEDRVGRVAPLVGLARINRDFGNTPEVVHQLEAATAILEPMLAADPNSQRTRRQLGLVSQDLARALGSPRSFHINQRGRAVETLRKALSLRRPEGRPGDPPDIDAMTSRAMMHLDLAAMLVQSDPAASLAAVEAALGWTGAILARNPNDARTARIHHTLEEELANTRLQLGQPGLGLAVLERFHVFYLAALKKDPEDLSLLDGFGKVQSARAKALTALARWTEAEAALDTAEADTARVTAKYGDDLYFLRNHAWVLEAFGDFWRVRGETAKSQEYYRRAHEIWARWARIVPTGHPYPELFASVLKRKLADPKNMALVARILDR